MKTLKSIVSLLLVLVFVVQLMPISSLAVELGETGTTETIKTTQPEQETYSEVPFERDSDNAPYIIGEIEDRREEAVKHFRMSDGSFTMVQYSEPVHFQDASGLWQNIDNTLVARNGRFVSENGAVKKSFASSMADEELLRISYEDYSVGMSYVVPATADKPVQPDLPAVEAFAEETVEQTKEQAESQTEVRIDANASEVAETNDQSAMDSTTPTPTDAIEDTKQKKADAVTELSRPADDQIASVAALDLYVPIEGTAYSMHKDSRVKANVENTSPKAIANISVSEALAQEGATSKIQFANVDSNIDLVYENRGYNIKESILIHSQQEKYTYAFELDVQGLKPALQEDGSILLRV